MGNLALSLTAVSLLLLASCSRSTQPDDAGEKASPAPVQVEVAKREDIKNLITAEAVLYPVAQASIVPKISAPVARFLAQRGDHVKRGQLLATLEDKDLVASAEESKQLFEQAQASYQTTVGAAMPDELTKATTDVETARQTKEAAQRAFDSRQKLLQQGALSQRLVEDSRVTLVQANSQYETARQHLASLQSLGREEQMKGAKAQMAAAEAHYQSANSQVSYAEVRSPITGVVSDRPLNVGEMASSSSALISIVDLSRVVARATVAIGEAAVMAVGKPATISDGNAELPGKVTVVSPAVDPNTTTIQVWVEAANPGEHLKSGTTVKIIVDAGTIRDALVIPATALLSSDEGGEKVMVAGKDSVAHERPVKVGVRYGDDVQILSGIAEGEQVITQGALGLDDKAAIQISAGEHDQK